MRTKLTVAAIALLVPVALTLAAQNSFTLKKTPKVGDVRKYKHTAKFELPGQTLDMESVLTDKITDLQSNGNYSVEETTTGFQVNGKAAAVDMPPITTVYAPSGEIVEIKIENLTPAMYRLSNMALFIMPPSSLRIGDSWTYTIKADAKRGIPDGSAKYTLLGAEKYAGYDTFKVRFSIQETGTDPASSEGTAWISSTDGTLIKMTTKWKNVPVQTDSGVASIKGDIAMELVH